MTDNVPAQGGDNCRRDRSESEAAAEAGREREKKLQHQHVLQQIAIRGQECRRRCISGLNQRLEKRMRVMLMRAREEALRGERSRLLKLGSERSRQEAMLLQQKFRESVAKKSHEKMLEHSRKLVPLSSIDSSRERAGITEEGIPPALSIAEAAKKGFREQQRKRREVAALEKAARDSMKKLKADMEARYLRRQEQVAERAREREALEALRQVKVAESRLKQAEARKAKALATSQRLESLIKKQEAQQLAKLEHLEQVKTRDKERQFINECLRKSIRAEGIYASEQRAQKIQRAQAACREIEEERLRRYAVHREQKAAATERQEVLKSQIQAERIADAIRKRKRHEEVTHRVNHMVVRKRLEQVERIIEKNKKSAAILLAEKQAHESRKTREEVRRKKVSERIKGIYAAREEHAEIRAQERSLKDEHFQARKASAEKNRREMIARRNERREKARRQVRERAKSHRQSRVVHRSLNREADNHSRARLLLGTPEVRARRTGFMSSEPEREPWLASKELEKAKSKSIKHLEYLLAQHKVLMQRVVDEEELAEYQRQVLIESLPPLERERASKHYKQRRLKAVERIQRLQADHEISFRHHVNMAGLEPQTELSHDSVHGIWDHKHTIVHQVRPQSHQTRHSASHMIESSPADAEQTRPATTGLTHERASRSSIFSTGRGKEGRPRSRSSVASSRPTSGNSSKATSSPSSRLSSRSSSRPSSRIARRPLSRCSLPSGGDSKISRRRPLSRSSAKSSRRSSRPPSRPDSQQSVSSQMLTDLGIH